MTGVRVLDADRDIPGVRVLALDAGNSRIKWGLHDGTRFVARGAVETAQPDLGPAWASGTIAKVVASNVAGEAIRARIADECGKRNLPLAFVTSRAEQLGVTSRYEDPAQLGTDRWVALVAAHHAERGDKLVVNVGTALTIDMLTADGEFRGGVIVPGPALMRRSLDRGTAGLRLTEGRYREMPRCTPDAITTGAVHAAVGAIERMARIMASQGNEPGAVVLSGGAAAEIAPHLSIAATIHENLVLDGLVLIARAG